MSYPFERRLGATPQRNGRTEFRVWAPEPDQVALRVNGSDHALEHAGYGIHEATVDANAGDDYVFVLDGTPLPDPCSRWQPEGLRGPSRVVDTTAFEWTDVELPHPRAAGRGDLRAAHRHVLARRHVRRRDRTSPGHWPSWA